MRVTSIPWRNTIFVRMLATFLAILVPIYVLSLSLYNRGLNAARVEIEKSALSQTSFYLQGLEQEIERIRILQYDCLNDDSLEKLTYRHEALLPYETLDRIQLLRSRLYSIQNSSAYIRNVRVHVSPIRRTISSVDGLDGLDEASFVNHRIPANLSGAQILHLDGRMLLSTLKADRAMNATALSMVEIELEPDTFQHALAQFNAWPGSGSYLVDLESGGIVEQRTEDGDPIPTGISPTGLATPVSTLPDESSTSTLPAEPLASPETHVDRQPSATAAGNGAQYIRVGGTGYLLLQVQSDYLNLQLVRYIPDRFVLEPLRAFHAWVWGFAAVALAVILGYSIFAYRSMHKPLVELVSSFQRVENGDLKVVIPHDPHNEFGYLYKRFNAMVRNLDTLIDQSYRQRILVQRAELRQLQSQINPHFLYNSFFILNTMARLGDTDSLVIFTKQLGEYFRFIARNASDEVPLAQEAQHAQIYADIQAMRFSRRMQVSFDIPPEPVSGLMVPRLILQPIIENAFMHSLEKKERNGLLQVRFEVEADRLRIIVSDNGDTLADDRLAELRKRLDSEDEQAEVTGLTNIHRRVRLRFGAESGLRLERSAMGGLQATIEIWTKGGAEHVQTADRG